MGQKPFQSKRRSLDSYFLKYLKKTTRRYIHSYAHYEVFIALNQKDILFKHVPLLFNSDGSKLSKK